MSDFVQGQGGDFSSNDQPPAAADSSASGFFSKAWQVTQKLASDVGVPDVFSDVHRKVNVLKAQQMGNKLELVEKIDEVENALEHIKETHEKYGPFVHVLSEGTNAAAKCAPPLRKAGGYLLRCAGISDKVARDMAASEGEGFFKETPTYQQDLNEALSVTSAALLYQADRLEEYYTTAGTLDSTRGNFEQGSYSTKHYVKKERFGPGPMSESLKALQGLVSGEVVAADRAARKYHEFRLDLSVRKMEHEDLKARGKLNAEGIRVGDAAIEKGMETLTILRDDVLAANRLLIEAKKAAVGAEVRRLLTAERDMHRAAIKSLEATLAALPNSPVPQTEDYV